LSAVGRFGDIALFLIPFPFFALIIMSVSASDLSALLPIAQTPPRTLFAAVRDSGMPFADVVLLLPLLMRLEYKKGDVKKISIGYGAGAAATLLFLALFYGVYSSSAGREHYAFSKIAQYFPALDVIGRFDLLFVYMLTIVLLFFSAMPLQYATQLICEGFQVKSGVFVSIILNVGALLFLLFANRRYNAVYELISGKLPFLFWLIADMVPLFFLFLPKNAKKEEKINA
ncbi:MAG: GerAB/ArcD/ProY family transporter, partial [Clostridia bacterium]|nr:GerAB/ArcD/ProY family transporter [Clostridia bacterium]